MPTLFAAGEVDVSPYGPGGLDLAGLCAPEGERAQHERSVYSQLQRQELGVCMAPNRRWRYFYSAPDRREFLFDRAQDLEELGNRAGVPTCCETLEAMRRQLWDHFGSDGYADQLDGNE